MVYLFTIQDTFVIAKGLVLSGIACHGRESRAPVTGEAIEIRLASGETIRATALSVEVRRSCFSEGSPNVFILIGADIERHVLIRGSEVWGE